MNQYTEADPNEQVRVSLLGHSFIKRFRNFMHLRNDVGNLNLSYTNYKIDIRTKGGLTVRDLAGCPDFATFSEPIPCICFLQIGGNDAMIDKPEIVAHNIFSFASYLHVGVGIRHVIIGQLLRRQPWASSPRYNRDIVRINQLVSEEARQTEGVHFWHHRGFWTDLDFLGSDGVHLRCTKRCSAPMRRYLRSIRSAILSYARKQ